MTELEIEKFIKENYRNMTVKEISKAIKLNENTIRTKAFRMGITKRNYITDKDLYEGEYFKEMRDFPRYEISCYGRFRNKKNHMEIQHGYTKEDRYHTIKLRTDKGRFIKRVHRLVMLEFSDEEPQESIDHIDANKDNNHISNLNYCTHSENLQNSYDLNLRESQKGQPNTKYSNELIIKICELLQEGQSSQYEISEKLGINRTLVRDVKSRTTHKDVSINYNW